MKVRFAFATIAVIGILILLVSTGLYSYAQDKPQTRVIQATAKGTGEQMARETGVELTIYSYSGPEERQALWNAFTQGGHEAVAAELKKMPVRGKLWFSGEVPYDVAYVHEILAPDGSRIIRAVTNRFVTLPEMGGRAKWAADFDLSAIEFTLDPDPKKSTGIFAPACQFNMDKEKGLQIALYQNPWNLIWISEKTGK